MPNNEQVYYARFGKDGKLPPLPPSLVDPLRKNSNWDNLTVAQQLEIAQMYLTKVLPMLPQFRQMSQSDQLRFLRQQLILAPTSNLRGLGTTTDPLDFTKRQALDWLNNQPGSKEALYTGKAGRAFMDSSGTMSLMKELSNTLNNATQFAGNQRDIVNTFHTRSKEYLQAIEGIMGESTGNTTFPVLAGSLLDILVVNSAMSGITNAATTDIKAYARGMKAADYAKALDTGAKLSPVVRPLTNFFAPIATETLIEAVPYFVLSEIRTASNGEKPIISQGGAKVLQTLGTNAAQDFIFGTLVYGLLRTVGKVSKHITLHSPNVNKVALKLAQATMDEGEFDDLLRSMRSNLGAPEQWTRASDVDLAWCNTQQIHYNGLDSLAAKADTIDPRFPVSNIAIRTATPFDIQQGTTPGTTLYKVFEYDTQTKRYAPIVFNDFNDMENYYAIRIYKALEEEPNLRARYDSDDPLLMSYYNRGKAIYEKRAILGEVSATMPELKLTSIDKRPVILDSEANRIIELSKSSNDYVAIKTHLDLPEDVISRILKSDTAPLPSAVLSKVAPSEQGNVLLLGTRLAPNDVYNTAATQALKLSEETGIPADAIRRSILLNKGYDYYIHPDSTYEFFSNASARFIGSPNDVARTFKNAIDTSTIDSTFLVEQKASLKVTRETLFKHPKLASSAFYYTLRNGNDLTNYNYLLKAILPDDVNARVIYNAGSDITIKKVDDTLEVSIPRHIPKTENAEQALHNAFFKQLAPYIKPTNRTSSYIINQIVQAKQPNILATMPHSELLVKRLADKLAYPLTIAGDTITLTTPKGQLFFDNISEAIDYLAPRSVDLTTLKADFMRQGIVLTYNKKKDLYTAYSTIDKRVIAKGSLDDIITATSYKPQYLDIAFAPQIESLNPDSTITLSYNEQKFVKSQAEAMQLLDKFKDSAKLNKFKEKYRNADGSISLTPTEHYYVYNNRLNVGFTFESPIEARKWLETKTYNLEQYQEIANKKFLDLDRTPTGYRITAKDAVYNVKTPTELEEVLRKYPDTEYSVPEMLDTIDPRLSAAISDISDTFAKTKRIAKKNRFGLPPTTDEAKPLNTWLSIRLETSQTENLILDLSQRLNLPELKNHFYAITYGHKRAIEEINKYSDVLRAAITYDGKVLSRRSLAKVYYKLAATSDEDAAALAKQALAKWGIEATEHLTDQEQLAVTRLKALYKDLSIRFHIDAEKLLYHYMPRLRDWYNDPANRQLAARIVTGDDLLNYTRTDTPSLKAFFENERISDIANYWVNDNPIELTLIYLNQGFKKHHMGIAWKNLTDYMEAAKLPEPVVTRLNFWRDQLMGTYKAPDEKFLESVGETFMTKLYDSKLGKHFAGERTREDFIRTGKHLYKTAYGLTYFTQLGWKYFVAVRNCIDALFIQGASRLGLPTILDAFEFVTKQNDNFFDYLRKTGVIFERSPVLNDITPFSTLASKAQNSAFKFLANSDDLNRAVIYTAATHRLTDAIELQKLGKLQIRQAFEEYIGSDMLDKGISDYLWDMYSNKKMPLEQFKHEFGLRMISATQEDLSGANAPKMFRTTFIGKLFGQYGNFSAGYRARITKLFVGNNASFKRKLTVAASVALTTLAFNEVFQSLKIKTDDFVPLQPGVFTGGPTFNLLIDILRGANPADPLAPYYRKRALNSVGQGTIPGYHYIRKALKYMNEGNQYGVILALMGASYNDEPE